MCLMWLFCNALILGAGGCSCLQRADCVIFGLLSNLSLQGMEAAVRLRRNPVASSAVQYCPLASERCSCSMCTIGEAGELMDQPNAAARKAMIKPHA